jgi:ferrous iron transport protein A
MAESQTRSIVPLYEVSGGTDAVVHDLQGGREFLGRLATLGFTPGASLTMLQNYGHGPVIVCLHDARIALGRGEAGKVRVVVQNHASG